MLTPIINRKAKQDHVTLHPVVKYYKSPEYSLDLYADPPETYSVDSRKAGSHSHRNYFDDLRSSQNEKARANGSTLKQHSFDKKNVVIIGPKDYIQNSNGVIIQNRIYYPPYQAYQVNPQQLAAMKTPDHQKTQKNYQLKGVKDLAYKEKQYLGDSKNSMTLFQNHLQAHHKKNDSSFSQSNQSTRKVNNSIFLPAAKGSLSTTTQSPIQQIW